MSVYFTSIYNGNGASDIWELLCGAAGFEMNFDSDGDGVPNRLEAIAGTDPRDIRSVARISGFRMTTNGFEVMVNGALGKRYELQVSEAAGDSLSANWSPEAAVVARTNLVVTFISPADRPSKFFRIGVSDVDTDGDGLNDWEEYQLGLDPLSAISNGHSDSYGARMNDYRYVTNRLSTQSLASLMAGTLASRSQNPEPVCGVAASAGFPIAASVSPTGTGLTGQYYTKDRKSVV